MNNMGPNKKTHQQRLQDYMDNKTYLPKFMKSHESQCGILKAFNKSKNIRGPNNNPTIIMDFLSFMGERGYKLKKMGGDLPFKSIQEPKKEHTETVDDMLERINNE